MFLIVLKSLVHFSVELVCKQTKLNHVDDSTTATTTTTIILTFHCNKFVSKLS